MTFLIKSFLVEHTYLNHFFVQVLLAASARKDAFFYNRASDEPVKTDFLLLADSMRAILGLLVHLGIEI